MLDSKSWAMIIVILFILITMFKPQLTRFYENSKFKLYRISIILSRYLFGGLSDN